MLVTILKYKRKLSASQWFMLGILFVNVGNYSYNLVLGRWLGPHIFADVALLITLLLMLSFLAMTLQLLCAKFQIELEETKIESFKILIYKYSLILGSTLTFLCFLFAKDLQKLFKLDSHIVFYLFGIGIPIYFIMSISRGFHQGKQDFIKLSQSYVTEMLGRLLVTFLLIGLAIVKPTVAVTIGILFSFLIGVFPNTINFTKFKSSVKINSEEQQLILKFIIITALYECTQIIINNSDILIVKHYFDNIEAGLYASLALIGRVVYFFTWMLIMVLLPKVIEAKKRGENSKKILKPYLKFITLLTTVLVTFCYLFPEEIITIFFGKAFIEMSPLLYKYALATSLFALANLFVYYFLSLSNYIPVAIAMLFGIAQVFFLMLFHKTITQVVEIQISLMFVLLVVMLVWYFKK